VKNKREARKPPPISVTNGKYLRGLAMNFGFKRFLTANIHFDLLGLSFGFLGQANLQHALVVVGIHLP
jgi:hypothetical protein